MCPTLFADKRHIPRRPSDAVCTEPRLFCSTACRPSPPHPSFFLAHGSLSFFSHEPPPRRRTSLSIARRQSGDAAVGRGGRPQRAPLQLSAQPGPLAVARGAGGCCQLAHLVPGGRRWCGAGTSQCGLRRFPIAPSITRLAASWRLPCPRQLSVPFATLLGPGIGSKRTLRTTPDTPSVSNHPVHMANNPAPR